MLNPLLILEKARKKTLTRLSGGRLKSVLRWGWRLTIRPFHVTLLRFMARRQGLNLPPGWERSHLMARMALGAYEEETASLIRETVRPGDNALDIGAHIGYFTRLLSKCVGPSGHVVAFEPHPLNFDLLAKNTSRYQNVEAVNKAVSDVDGKIKLYVSAYTGRHSLIFMEESAVQDEIEIAATTLDTFWEQHGRFPVHLIKMDVEGAETFVLKGAENLIRENRELRLITEFCPEYLHSAGIEPRALLEQLRGYGFRPLAILDGDLIDVRQVDWEGRKYLNLFCERDRS